MTGIGMANDISEILGKDVTDDQMYQILKSFQDAGISIGLTAGSSLPFGLGVKTFRIAPAIMGAGTEEELTETELETAKAKQMTSIIQMLMDGTVPEAVLISRFGADAVEEAKKRLQQGR